jgi:hypothetical protein
MGNRNYVVLGMGIDAACRTQSEADLVALGLSMGYRDVTFQVWCGMQRIACYFNGKAIKETEHGTI